MNDNKTSPQIHEHKFGRHFTTYKKTGFIAKNYPIPFVRPVLLNSDTIEVWLSSG